MNDKRYKAAKLLTEGRSNRAIAMILGVTHAELVELLTPTLEQRAISMRARGFNVAKIASALRLPHNRVAGFFNPRSALFRKKLG